MANPFEAQRSCRENDCAHDMSHVFEKNGTRYAFCGLEGSCPNFEGVVSSQVRVLTEDHDVTPHPSDIPAPAPTPAPPTE